MKTYNLKKLTERAAELGMYPRLIHRHILENFPESEHCCEASVYRVMNGKRTKPTVVKSVAKVLGFELVDLMSKRRAS